MNASTNQHYPEITCKAVILAIILTVVLTAANAYLGLKVGMTISASIPAAAISMGILRLFRNSNCLENNIVQTAASAGEALVAGIIFVLPALLIMQFWHAFNYVETSLVAVLGGVLGVLFSIPLRRVLLAEKTLSFPEGTAIGQVLNTNTEDKAGFKRLTQGGIMGAVVSFMQSGLQVIADASAYWFKSGHHFIYGGAIGFEPTLLAAGYIVGIQVVMSTFVGVVIAWLIGVPVLSYVSGFGVSQDASTVVLAIWKTQIRYIGVGTMLVGGLWTLVTLVKPVIRGLKSSFQSINAVRTGGYSALPRTEQDIPIHYALSLLVVVMIPLVFLFHSFIAHLNLSASFSVQLTILIFAAVFTIIAGFIFASLCGYFAGLVGSSNNPLSGLAMSALLLASLSLLGLLALTDTQLADEVSKLAVAAFIIFLTTVILCAAAITNDTIQDLKAGQIVGATPWKQQVMLMLGTLVAALVIPPILQLLFNAYGLGTVFPHSGMNPAQALSAPQAMLMATLVQAVFSHQLPWTMLTVGALVAVFCVIVDTFLQRKNKRLPVLAVGLGIYLPMSISVPFILGGVTSYLVRRTLDRRSSKGEGDLKSGLIGACGVVAGASLMGVILAVPFTLAKSTDILKIMPDSYAGVSSCLGIISILWILGWIYRVACKT